MNPWPGPSAVPQSDIALPGLPRFRSLSSTAASPLEWRLTLILVDYSQTPQCPFHAEPVHFADPDPFAELTFPTALAAKRAVADYLGWPLAKLSAEQRADLDQFLAGTLRKQAVIDYARTRLKPIVQR